MKRGMFVTVAALVVAFALSGATAYAQVMSADRRVNAKIDFAFTAGDKEFGPGSYGFEVSPAGPVVVTAPDGARVLLPVITTLGRHDKDPDPEFVFDKIGGKFLLSEVWMPGKDGLLLLASKGSHEHGVVGGSNPRR